jgi:hypothetical protein
LLERVSENETDDEIESDSTDEKLVVREIVPEKDSVSSKLVETVFDGRTETVVDAEKLVSYESEIVSDTVDVKELVFSLVLEAVTE